MDGTTSDGAAGDDRRKAFRACGLAEVACRMIRGVEAARKALTVAVRSIMWGVGEGRPIEVVEVELCSDWG